MWHIVVAIIGIINILSGIIEGFLHGKPRGTNYNAGVGLINILIGIVILLFTFGIIE